jgi:U3 small nucleolar RNA-associated protein MPP10
MFRATQNSSLSQTLLEEKGIISQQLILSSLESKPSSNSSKIMSEETKEEEASPLDALIEVLDQPEARILPLLLSSKKQDDDTATTTTTTKQELLQACQHLFQQIEGLAKTFHSLQQNPSTDDAAAAGKDTPPLSSLSGLDQLFLHDGMDAETVWGQVDLQNEALKKLLKKSVKRLGKASPEDICVLNMNEVLSDDDEEEADESSGDDESMQGSNEEEDDSENDEDEDEETRRIRERMERAMDDMDSEDENEEADDDDNSEHDSDVDKHAKKKAASSSKGDAADDEPLFDPVAEDLKDGFFDLNEMEDFADEEEEYLPDEAFGQPQKEKKPAKKKSFHQRQRDGDLESGSDEDDEDEFEEDMPVRRKKYRDDEDIDALYNLYQGQQDMDDDEDDAINMTAADFFGQPKKKYIEQYKKKHPQQKKSKNQDDDEDSWGDYDFEKEEKKVGWADNQDDDEHSEDEGDHDASEHEDDDESESDGQDDADTSDKKKDTSRFAKQTEKLKKQTEELEREMIAEKPWQMTGEAKGSSRPVNSLLEGTPEFQVASKQAPVITVEHTADLEEVIKKRIIAEDWDDVVPRELPDIGWHKKRGELPEVSQEKSKLGLGELYEREYLKKAVGYDKDAEEIKTEEDKAKDEMKQLFANLCSKLDALSNYHFAPRPVADEAEARPVTTPAIAMEEVLPLHVSDARGVAPEEVYGAKRGREGILRDDTELEQSERKRLRQSKKAARRKKRKEKLADEKLISRLEPGLGLNNPYEKRKAREELQMARASGRVTTGEQDANTKYGSSGTFFKRLQAEAQQTIKGTATDAYEEKEKRGKPKSSAFKL